MPKPIELIAECNFITSIEGKYFDKIPSNSPLPKGRTYDDPPFGKGGIRGILI